MPRRESPLHGLLLVDKPGLQQVAASQSIPTSPNDLRLYTSHDIVQLIRRWSGQRRIGHTGTLDPMASGLMVLCLGQATRLVEYYQGHDKWYDAEITLGLTTNTYDALGETIATAEVPPFSRAEIETALMQFRGKILQKPPIYSALKQGGESLHRKARRGEDVQVQPRPVTIHQLDLLNHDDLRLNLRVHCSAGTYIRSLAHDIGEALECHAHLSALRRTCAGSFTVEEGLSLSTLEEEAEANQLETHLLPMGAKLTMPILVLDDILLKRLGYGQKVLIDNVYAMAASHQFQQAMQREVEMGSLAQVQDGQQNFCGIIRCLEWHSSQRSLWKAEKWLAGSE